MQTRTAVLFFVGVLAAVALNCTGQLSATSGGEGGAGASSPGTPQYPQGTVGASCSPGAEGCSWAINECSGDPVCARWYKCVLACPASTGLADCRKTCNDGYALTATRQQIESCLFSGDGCRGPSGKDQNGGSGGRGLGPSNDAAASWQAGDAAVEARHATCHDCAWTDCLAPICTAQGTDICYAYKYAFLTCADLQDQGEVEECLYEKEQADAAFKNSHDKIGGDALSCIWGKCVIECVPSGYRDCLMCQQAMCVDEYAAYVSSPPAQDYAWCRSHCDHGTGPDGGPIPDPAACKDGCRATYPDGAAIVSILVGCEYQNCGDYCKQ